MDPLLTLIVIEQTIATIVIAVAIFVHSRATTRILEAHVEPEVHVTVEGGPDSNLLAITNDAKCTISNLNVVISVGCIWNSQPYTARHCLYFGAWPTIDAISEDTTVAQPLKAGAFANAELPDGAKLDLNDIVVEYSFTRTADRRRYDFGYRLGLFRLSDGKLVYVRMGQPKLLKQASCAFEENAGMPASLGPGAMPVVSSPLPVTDLNGAGSAYCIG